MTLIVDTQALEKALKSFEESDDFVTMDTEFIREDTYWPKLSLVQIAGQHSTILIDPLSQQLSLDPLFTFLKNDQILKVFHAGRQDLEIFYHLTGEVPQEIFDTQVAAMVCGYGEQVGYETLVSSILGRKLDKTQQYSPWLRRPLSNRQLQYARDDVIHLRKIYLHLLQELKQQNRQDWILKDLEVLKSLKTYQPDPEGMWMKLRLKNANPHYLARLKAIAALREVEAIDKNVPRNRLLRDDIITELASHMPETLEAFLEIRGIHSSFINTPLATSILNAIKQANALAVEDCPRLDAATPGRKPSSLHLDCLRLLLKSRAEQHKVAEKLIATTKDLEQFLLLPEADLQHNLFQGWRYEIFGADAWSLKEGKKSLVMTKRGIALKDYESQPL